MLQLIILLLIAIPWMIVIFFFLISQKGSTNHSSDYTYSDQLVILITSRIGPHDFSIHSMYVYYPTADSDTVGDGYELPIEDIILQQKTAESMKYTYTIS